MAGPTFENTVLPDDQEQIKGEQQIPPEGLHATHRGSLAINLPTGDKRNLTKGKW